MLNSYSSLIFIISLLIVVSCSTESTPVYTLSVTAEPSEAGTVSPASGEYDEGEQVEITASPNEHWVFDRWQGDHTGNANPAMISMGSDKEISAVFTKKEYPLTINIEGEGTVDERIIQQKTTDYPHGTIVELAANPDDGWTFIEWGGDLSGNEEPITITITDEKNVTVIFEPTVYLGENGVTIMCPNGEVGDIGIVNGVEYEVVDYELLRQRLEEGKGSFSTNICVSKVTDMRSLFSGIGFNEPIQNWDVSNVTDMNRMFRDTPFNHPIGDWDVSSVRNMSFMFYESQFNQPIGDWDVSNVGNMSYMFSRSSFNQPLGDWNVSKVSNMLGIFSRTLFNQPIGDWDVSNVTNMGEMFINSPFNHSIGNWDVSSVKDMRLMFIRSEFNQPIRDWDTENVTDMTMMFWNSKFNQNISNWCVWRIGTEPRDFSTNLSPENKPVWGTCPD